MEDKAKEPAKIYDVFVIGGGVNGCGIARDAAGRGLLVGLAESGDIGGATSSASTKLFHGGLRYLEYFEFKLVKEALQEREVLLKMMPHISWPMRFVLPLYRDMRFDKSTPASRLLSRFMPWLKGRRPSWMIRLGLFLYDYIGGRKILPPTASVSLLGSAEGEVLQKHFVKAYEYSDVWVQDARLVVLNARDAQQRGAHIMPRTKVIKARRDGGIWHITIDNENHEQTDIRAKALINATGPWVEKVGAIIGAPNTYQLRLVRGSHIVTRRLYDHDKCYFLQGKDGRIVFIIPYEGDFSLIGTTEQEHFDLLQRPLCSPDEKRYLLDFVNDYLSVKLEEKDIVWSYSGVRPLFEARHPDDGSASATELTREYNLLLDTGGGNGRDAPLLTVLGGKLTTYRSLAEKAVNQIAPFFAAVSPEWSAHSHLPGGDFPIDGFSGILERLMKEYPFLTYSHAHRLVRSYGTDAWYILKSAKSIQDLGENFGATLTQAEVDWLIKHEFAKSADDILWRRTKLGLHFTTAQTAQLNEWVLKHKAQ